jgi:HEXXH motif-containing protein
MWAVERSRRMLMLRAVVDLARQGGPGAPLSPDSAMELLLRVDRARPDVVVDLLEHPGTGIWAVRTLERLRSGEQPHDTADGAPPLWAEVGYLHCLAAAGALRSGVEGTIRLPVHGTRVALPTLGRIRLPDPVADGPGATRQGVVTLCLPHAPEGRALLLVGEQRLVLPADLRREDDGWEPSYRIEWSPRPQDPLLTLEDGDPYRDFRSGHPSVSAPGLTATEARRWRLLLGEVGEVLHGRHPRAASLLTEALRVLVPLPAAPRFRTASASYNEAVGAALLSLPHDATELAVTLVHEARHSVLNGLLHQLSLYDDGPLLYAPWRGDPRPLSGVLHGTYAFAGVADFWRVERRALSGPPAALAHFEFAVWRAAIAEALGTLLASDGLTGVGRRFVVRMAHEAEAWDGEEVPAKPLAVARAEVADLRAVWRGRHLRPHPGQVALLADAWLRGTDPGAVGEAPGRLRPEPGASSPDLRSELRRVLMADPGALERRARFGPAAATRPEALAAADIDLLMGAAKDAVPGYRAVLAEYPQSASAWVGLGLALNEAGEPGPARALLDRPELVQAVHEQVSASRGGAADPVAVADWIARTAAVSGEN